MWHAALLLLIFSMINLAVTPFSFAAGMAVRAIKMKENIEDSKDICRERI